MHVTWHMHDAGYMSLLGQLTVAGDVTEEQFQGTQTVPGQHKGAPAQALVLACACIEYGHGCEPSHRAWTHGAKATDEMRPHITTTSMQNDLKSYQRTKTTKSWCWKVSCRHRNNQHLQHAHQDSMHEAPRLAQQCASHTRALPSASAACRCLCPCVHPCAMPMLHVQTHSQARSWALPP